MIEKELHLVIVWDAASEAFDEIIDVIDGKFAIRKVYEITWDEELFIKNLISFYSHSQYHLNQRKANQLFVGKANYCGIAPFKLIIFEDGSPNYKSRNTSSGVRDVNINVFDLKTQFRELTGGGHKIHGTDSVQETNKDLTLLLGNNLVDFDEEYPDIWDRRVIPLKRNITGVNGYNSLKEFFYILNASIKHVVLRNFEGFPDSYKSKEHGDIDLLVENLNFIVYLTGAKKVFRRRNRVHYSINIGGENILFDFRYVGDNYYDIQWQERILSSRVLLSKSFYVPNDENLFYSLLYHALVHKPVISSDYISKLNNYGLKYSFSISLRNIKENFDFLSVYLKSRKYSYVIPKDYSVFCVKNKVDYINQVDINRYIYRIVVDIKMFLKAKIIR